MLSVISCHDWYRPIQDTLLICSTSHYSVYCITNIYISLQSLVVPFPSSGGCVRVKKRVVVLCTLKL